MKSVLRLACLLAGALWIASCGEAEDVSQANNPVAIQLFAVAKAPFVDVDTLVGVWGGSMSTSKDADHEVRLHFEDDALTVAVRCQFFNDDQKLRKTLYAAAKVGATFSARAIRANDDVEEIVRNEDDECRASTESFRFVNYSISESGRLYVGADSDKLILIKYSDEFKP